MVLAGAFGCVSQAGAAPASASWRASTPASSRAGWAPSPPRTGRLRSPAARRALSRDAVGANAISPALGGAGSQISGKVTSAATETAIAGIEVCAWGAEETLLPPCAITGADGEYTISGLEPGTYIVEFDGSVETKLGYARQYYNDETSESKANPVEVGEAPVSGINAALQPGGEVTGTVTNTKEEPLQKVEVCALDAEEFPERCTLTNAQGQYTIVGVAAGEHDVEFATAPADAENYATQYYNGKESLSQADAVMVSATPPRPASTPRSWPAARSPGR